MATYIGFSTVDGCKPKTTNASIGNAGGVGNIRKGITFGKKYRITDEQLVILDFVNALNIPQGQKVGQPEYGTLLWTFLFEPNTADVQFKLEQEIKRVAGLDPRIILNTVKAFPQENGILLEVELAIAPFNEPQTINVFFNQGLNRAILR